MLTKAELYYDFVSQPCRAVMSLVELTGLSDIVGFRHAPVMNDFVRSDEYTLLNPNQKVPFYHDSDVRLFESGAIMRYLCGNHLPASHPMYPRDQPQATAQVELALQVYHKCARYSSRYFFAVVRSKVSGRIFDLKGEASQAYVICKLLDTWISEHGGRMVGPDQWNIADLLIFHEIMNLNMAEEFSLNNKNLPNLHAFLKDFTKTKGLGMSVAKLRTELEDAGKNVEIAS